MSYESSDGFMPTEVSDDTEKVPKKLFPIIPYELRVLSLPATEKNGEGVAWLPTREIIRLSGTTERRFYRFVEETAIVPVIGEYEGQPTALYPPHTSAIVRDEMIWRDAYKKLPGVMTRQAMADFLGVSRGWIDTRFILNSVLPKLTRQVSGHSPRRYFSKTLLPELRAYLMQHPLADDWNNLSQLVEYTGLDRQYIQKQLEKAGYIPEKRWSAYSTRLLDHYPPEALTYLYEVQSKPVPYGGDWFTVELLSERTGRSRNWLLKRLELYDSAAELRRDDTGAMREHYPPEVRLEITRQSEELSALPERGEYLNPTAIARLTGHSTLVLLGILDKLHIPPETRVDGKGRPHQYYHPRTVMRVRQYDKEIKKSSHDPAYALQLRFAVGSLKSQLTANHKMIVLNQDDGEVVDELRRYAAQIQKKLREKRQRLAWVDPGFEM